MKNLLIIGYAPISQKLNLTLGIDKLVNFTKVDYWDVSPVIGNQGFPGPCTIPEVQEKRISSVSEYKKAVKGLGTDTIVIFYMMVKYDTVVFYRYLAKTPCKIAAVVTGSLPVFSNSHDRGSLNEKLKNWGNSFWRHLSLARLCLALKNKLALRSLHHIRPFDYYLYCGAKANYNDFNYNPKTFKIPISSYDYLLAKKSQKPDMVNGHYILFVDDYIPFHPDFLMNGVELVPPDTYFKEINSYFDKIEERYGLPVVIAAHPRADKYHEKDYFNGRQVIFNSTVGLSFHAEFVITHYSTAISYSVMNKIPIIFIYTDDMVSKIPSIGTVFAMADSLNCNSVNVSRSLDTSVFPVDEMRYDEYLFSYETSPETMSKDNSEIILDLLK